MARRKRRVGARRHDPTMKSASPPGANGGDAHSADKTRASFDWRRFKAPAAAALVVVALVVVIVGQIRPSPATLTAAAQPQRGAQLYEKYCVSCHGADGIGEPGWKYRERAAPALDSSGHAWHHEDEQLLSMILDKPAPDSVMPAWRGVLTRDDALDVIGYIKSLWTPYIRANCQGAKHMSCMSHG